MLTSQKVSIIIPIYNVATHLCKGLDSAICQTYRSIEIVCVDDGSTDDSPDILCEYAKRDNRIRIVTQANAGTLMARKAGVAVSTGDIIIFLDPDDTLIPTAVFEIVNEMNKNACGILTFGYTFCGRPFASRQEELFFYNHFNNCLQMFTSLSSRIDILNHCFVLHNIPYHQHGKAYRADLVKRAFLLIPSLRCIFAEDQGIALFIMNNATTMCFLDRQLYCYRLGSGISTQTTYTVEKYSQCLQSFDMLRAVKEYVALQTEHRLLLERIVQSIEGEMVRTAVLFIDRIEKGANPRFWVIPLLQNCPKIPLIIALFNYINCKFQRLFWVIMLVALLLLLALICFIVIHK